MTQWVWARGSIRAWWQLRRTTLLSESTPFEAAVLKGYHEFTPADRFETHPATDAINNMLEVRWRLSERSARVSLTDQLLWVLLVVAAVVPPFISNLHTWEGVGVGGARIATDTVGFWRNVRDYNGTASAFDVALRLGMSLVFAAVACLAYRMVRVWASLRSSLQALACTPLITGFERLPQRVSRLTRVSLWSPSADFVDSIAATQWVHLRALFLKNRKEFDQLTQADAALGADVSALMSDAGARSPKDFPEFVKRVFRVLEKCWLAEPSEAEVTRLAGMLTPAAGKEPVFRSASGAFRRTFEGADRVWLRTLEELVCVQIVDYLEWVATHLRAMAKALLVSIILMILFIGSYPFRPESGIKLTALVVMSGGIASLLLVMSQANRDDVLSRVAKTDPGRMTWDASFIMNLVLVGGLPLLALLATEFPTVRDFMFGWVQPIARLIGGAKG
jgi:hypothetical protein